MLYRSKLGTERLFVDVDLGAVQLRLEVVCVPTQEDERGGEEPDEHGGGGASRRLGVDDGPVLAVDLDALHEVEHGGQGGDLRLALAGASV